MSVIGGRSGITSGDETGTRVRPMSRMRLKSMDNTYPRMACISYIIYYNQDFIIIIISSITTVRSYTIIAIYSGGRNIYYSGLPLHFCGHQFRQLSMTIVRSAIATVIHCDGHRLCQSSIKIVRSAIATVIYCRRSTIALVIHYNSYAS